MSESETQDEQQDQEVKVHDNSPRKRVRHRKKLLYDKLLKQMEFYFSDANLSKDRFLGDLVKSDPFVPLETFLKFNKIRLITQEVSDIAKSMKNSSFLELSDDGLKVKRKNEMLPYDADERTVYVESIPVTASLDWLKRVFSDYGHVAYISLPKFKNSERIKGFAFVEFDKPEEAQKCMQTFTKMGCKLPTGMPPEDLSSIKMFSVDEPDEVQEKEEEPPKKKQKKLKDKKPQKNLDLKLLVTSDTQQQVETPTDDNKSIASVTTPTEDPTTTDAESKEGTSQDESKTDQETPRKKKPRKRSSKERSKAKNSLGKNEAPKGALWGLQVLSKLEWKNLRNKYLNLQRKYLKELRANLRHKQLNYSAIPAPAAPTLEIEPGITTCNTEGLKHLEIEKVPGVFVKEILTEPCLDVRLAKRTIRSNIHVKHVDVKEGQSEVIIRFDTPKAAEEYCANNRAFVLVGSEEDLQWSRLYNPAARRPRPARGPRGPRAPDHPQPTNTHIRYQDHDE